MPRVQLYVRHIPSLFSSTVPQPMQQKLSEQETLLNQIRRRKWTWLGHALRKCDGNITKQVLRCTTRVRTKIWESFSKLFHTWTTSFSKLFQVLLLCLYEQKHQQQLHEVQLKSYCDSIRFDEWWWQQQHLMIKLCKSHWHLTYSGKRTSLNWLMIFKVFQLVLHACKIIAKWWNNRYPCWVIFQVSAHTFHEFSKFFHTYHHFPWFSRPGKFTIWIPNFSRIYTNPDHRGRG